MIETETTPEEANDDCTVTISKDGTVRFSTGEVYTLQYPPAASGKPDPSYNYYVVEDGLPSNIRYCNVSVYGADDDELWFGKTLLDGTHWGEVFTRDGSLPYGF